MGFKLGSENRKMRTPSNTKLFREKLPDDTVAEARNDGTIAINEKVKPGSALERRAIKHEEKHIEQMKEGRANYGDNWLMWEGKIYFRKNGMIDGPAGRLPDGHPDHPWEQEAINAEKN